jgi:hypothetical protein
MADPSLCGNCGWWEGMPGKKGRCYVNPPQVVGSGQVIARQPRTLAVRPACQFFKAKPAATPKRKPAAKKKAAATRRRA